jgi:hypothetical protein
VAGPSRRQPWPYDIKWGVNSDGSGGTGLLLGRPKQGAPLIATRPQTMDQVAPPSFEYGAQNPLAERIQPYDDLSLGFGLYRQQTANDKRYRYAICGDLSVAGFWQKGPLITQYVPGTTDTTTGFGKFFELNGIVYCLVGRYCLQRVSDSSWTVSIDFGAGHAATDVVTFYSNALTKELAFVALGDSVYAYTFDGTTWTQSSWMYASHFCMVGRDLYRSNDTNFLSFCDTDADPTANGSWNNSNAFRVGDHTFPITALISDPFGSLVVIKQDGVYTIDQAGQDHMLYPYLRLSAGAYPENGKYTGTFSNDIYVNFGEQEYKLEAQLMLGRVHLNIKEVGPERLTQNFSPLKGRVTAFTGVGTMYALAGYYDDETGNSYLLKYGAWVQDQQGQSTRIDAWHGSISQQFSQKITALFTSGVGAASAHTRTYMLFADGSLGWMLNPCTPNPSNCADYAFTTNDAQIYLPYFHALFVADAKTWRGITVASLNLDGTTKWVDVQYRTDALSSISYTDVGTNFQNSPRQRQDLPSNTWGTLGDVLVILKSTTSTSSPQVTGIGVHYSVRPYLVLEYAFQVLVGEGMIKRDSTPFRATKDAITTLISTAAAAPGSQTIIMPDESYQELSVVDYGAAYAWDERLRSWSAALDVKAIQFKVVTVLGTISRLKPYTIGDLKAFTIGQLKYL